MEIRKRKIRAITWMANGIPAESVVDVVLSYLRTVRRSGVILEDQEPLKRPQLPPKPIIGVDLPKLVAVDITVYNGAAIKQLPMDEAMDGPKDDQPLLSLMPVRPGHQGGFFPMVSANDFLRYAIVIDPSFIASDQIWHKVLFSFPMEKFETKFFLVFLDFLR